MSEPLKLEPRQLDLVELIGKHKYVLAYGSSRGGKTFAFFYAMVVRALMYPGSNHAVIRQTGASIKTTVWDTATKVLKALAPGYRDEVQVNQTDRCITLHNGSTIWFLGAQNEEAVSKIMGAEFATILLNEVVDISFETYGDIISRLNAKDVDESGKRISLKLFADCNPKTFDHWVYQQWERRVIPGTNDPLYDSHEFASIEFDRHANSHVDSSYYDAFRNQSAAKQARFLHGVWRASSQDTLFSRDDLDGNRAELPDTFDEVVVAVDPAMTNAPDSDETGIVTVGAIGDDEERTFYPIADDSGRYHPHEWMKKAIDAYWSHGAGKLVVEVNQGGDVLVAGILAIDARVNVVTVRAGAGQGKNERAKPIAARMRAGKIHHPYDTEKFKELERQLLAMTGDYDRKKGKSPDRLDAYVYAISELLTGWTAKPLVVSKIANYFGS